MWEAHATWDLSLFLGVLTPQPNHHSFITAWNKWIPEWSPFIVNKTYIWISWRQIVRDLDDRNPILTFGVQTEKYISTQLLSYNYVKHILFFTFVVYVAALLGLAPLSRFGLSYSLVFFLSFFAFLTFICFQIV